ncbi:MAG: hypothetical protein V8S86_08285, partial [Eubacteriales bacterium]
CCACSKGGLCVTSSSTMEAAPAPPMAPASSALPPRRRWATTLSVIQVELTNVSGEDTSATGFTFFMSHS